VSERKTTEELAALLAGCVVAGLPVPRESSVLDVRAAFLAWRHAASQDDYRGISGFGVFPFDLPEVGSALEVNGDQFDVLTSRWGRKAEGDRVEYNLILRKSTKEQSMAVYGAFVCFTNRDLPEVAAEEDSPDKARVYALQKAKLTGNEPAFVSWATDDGDMVELWPSGERMSTSAYSERFPDDARRFRGSETVQG
jgi:hypothetical protein